MYDWPLNDAHLVLLVLAGVAVIMVGSIVTTLTTVRRAEFSRLQNEVKQLSMLQNEVKRLSKKIKALEADEERRFLMELNNPRRNAAKPSGSFSSVTTATDAVTGGTPGPKKK
jgi:Tfp pilus assembly protein PilN